MEYLLLNQRKAADLRTMESRPNAFDELLERYIREEIDPEPSYDDAIARELETYLREMDPMPVLPEDTRRTQEWARPPLAETGTIELCDDCLTLNDAVAKQVLYVLAYGTVIPRPALPVACLDELEADPSGALPLRCCTDCGKIMNPSVAVTPVAASEAHGDACCGTMQTAIGRGLVDLRMHASTMTAHLTSTASGHRIRLEHCGWCGMWLQLLRHARLLGPEFLRTWDRHHSRSAN